MSLQEEVLSFQTKEWSPIPRVSRTIPFGYEEDKNDSGTLQPIVFELEALEKAKKYLKQYSYREVAAWLSKTTGRYISHMGLKKRVDIEKHRRRKTATLKRWARRIEEVKSKIEDLEKKKIGSGETIS